jgi:hypothetical protein
MKVLFILLKLRLQFRKCSFAYAEFLPAFSVWQAHFHMIQAVPFLAIAIIVTIIAVDGFTALSLGLSRRDPSRWPRGTLYPQKLTLTWPTSGGRSVGIVRSRTQATEFILVSWLWYCMQERLCGLVVRVPGYRSRSPGSIPRTTIFSEK